MLQTKPQYTATYLSQLFVLTGVVILGAVFSALLGFSVATALVGLPTEKVTELLASPEQNPEAVFKIYMVAQAAMVLGGFIIAPSIYFKKSEGNDWAGVNPEGFSTPLFWVLGLGTMLLAIPLVGALMYINQQMAFPAFLEGFEAWAKNAEEQATELTTIMTTFNHPWKFVVGLVVIAILPGIGEELVFRGMLQRIFFNWLGNPHVAIWLAAGIFSAIHMQFYGFLPRLVLGALLGYVYYYSGSLWLAMAAHALNNASSLVGVWLFHLKVIDTNPLSEATDPIWPLAFGSIVGVVVLLLLQRRYFLRGIFQQQ